MPSLTVHVTSGADSGSGSLRQAFADIQDVNLGGGNQGTIIIDDTVTDIELDSTLIGNSVNLTTLTIVTEDDHDVTIHPPLVAPDEHSYRFMDHVGNNGLSVSFSHLIFDSFGSPVITVGQVVTDNGDGGTIRTNAPLTLSNCVFTDSVAGGSGGAVYTSTSLSATDCFFGAPVGSPFGLLPGNTANGDGGAICHILGNGTSQPLTLTNCVFTANESDNGNGGAIYFYTAEGTLTITGDDTSFTGNTAFSGHGGAIYQYGGHLYAVTSSTAGSSFASNADSGFVPGEANGNTMYLRELSFATLDIGSTDAYMRVSLRTAIPPTAPASGPTINLARIGIDDTNWALGWFY